MFPEFSKNVPEITFYYMLVQMTFFIVHLLYIGKALAFLFSIPNPVWAFLRPPQPFLKISQPFCTILPSNFFSSYLILHPQPFFSWIFSTPFSRDPQPFKGYPNCCPILPLTFFRDTRTFFPILFPPKAVLKTP